MALFSRTTERTQRRDGKIDGGPTRSGSATKALIAALILTSAVGCVGRKQYAINESILISERRQLEDEIYRLQFELRDALEENERLRGGARGDASGKSRGVDYPNAERTDAARRSAPTVAENSTFPGGGALNVSRPSNGSANAAARTAVENSGNYRNSNVAPATGGEVETLPDYVPIPLSSTTAPQRTPTSANGRSENLARADVAPGYSGGSAATNRTLGVRREIAVDRGTSQAFLAPSDAAPQVASTGYVEKNATDSSPIATDSAAQSADAWSPLSN